MSDKINEVRFHLSALSVYRGVLEQPGVQLFYKLLGRQFGDACEAAELYGQLLQVLDESESRGCWTNCLFDLVLYSDNLFTRESAANRFIGLPLWVKEGAEHDLKALCQAGAVTSKELKEHLAGLFPEEASLFKALPDYKTGLRTFKASANWAEDIVSFAEFARSHGYGNFARYSSFLLAVEEGKVALKPVTNPDPVRLAELKSYERERKVLIDNTLALLDGAKVNNVLLYGDRGTGKSSSVKAILNEYAPKGLRLVEVSKYHLKYLADLIELLQDIPLKFIIFADDLSFNENDDNYTAMKAVLDGSARKLADNTAIYATSNRRHLVKESFSAREGDEVHLADTMDEAASLSDRFGITITFLSPNRAKFNEIVLLLAKDQQLNVDEDTLLQQANAWAVRKSNFSPRCARQFIDHVISQISKK